jgi:hypothetical protein
MGLDDAKSFGFFRKENNTATATALSIFKTH